MTTNSVQSLHENKRKRGRPRSRFLEMVRPLWSDQVKSRSALYGKMREVEPGLCARQQLKVVDEDFRDSATGKRMSTKFSELGRIFPEGFWTTPDGETWMRDNWQTMVEMTVADFRRWVRKNNPRAKAANRPDLADVLADALNAYVADHPDTTHDDVKSALTVLQMAVNG